MKILTREEYHAKKWNKKIYWKEDCPFCDIEKNKQDEIIWKWKFWNIIYNIGSYSWDKNHIMAVPKIHKMFFSELNEEEILELKKVHEFVKKYFWEKQYFSFTRETLANRSVEHLHMHFLVWKLQWKFLRKMLELQWFPIKQELNF